MQSQKDREKLALKFNRIISHLTHGLANTEYNAKEAHKIFRNIQLASAEDEDEYVSKEKQVADQESEETLFDVLGTGSKPFNNMDSQLDVNIGGRDKQMMSEDNQISGSTKLMDPVRSVKCSYRQELEKLRASKPTTNKL